MNGEPRVLLVEDSPADAGLIRRMLEEPGAPRFDVTSVASLDESAKRLDEEAFDLVLLDLGLPDSWGLETFHKIFNRVPHVPIVVLTDLDDESVALECVRRGAQDYLVKGHGDGNLLVRVVSYAIWRKRAENILRDSEERLRQIAVTKGVAESPFGSGTVLVVEDEESLRELVSRILQMNGYHVLEARDGSEALTVCEQHEGPIGLLIADVVLPRMSGGRLAECLKPLRPDTKVLFTSGYSGCSPECQDVLDQGAPFIEKPFTASALVAKVREILDSSRTNECRRTGQAHRR